jgi:hypothetical protein
MNFGKLLNAVDAMIAFRDAARRLKGDAPPPPSTTDTTSLAQSAAASGLAGQIENRLTNVLVAALKEAFDRDHARLELERAQLEEQRRRAEEAMRLELRRQAADRELGRLRLLSATALGGWIASVIILVVRLGSIGIPGRATMAVGWVLLLAALGAAFSAQGRVGAYAPDSNQPLDPGAAGAVAVWLLIAGLAVSAISLLL